MKKYLHRYHELDEFKSDYTRDFNIAAIVCDDGNTYTLDGMQDSPCTYSFINNGYRSLHLTREELENLEVGSSVNGYIGTSSFSTTVSEIILDEIIKEPWVSYTTFVGPTKFKANLSVPDANINSTITFERKGIKKVRWNGSYSGRLFTKMRVWEGIYNNSSIFLATSGDDESTTPYYNPVILKEGKKYYTVLYRSGVNLSNVEVLETDDIKLVDYNNHVPTIELDVNDFSNESISSGSVTYPYGYWPVKLKNVSLEELQDGANYKIILKLKNSNTNRSKFFWNCTDSDIWDALDTNSGQELSVHESNEGKYFVVVDHGPE